MVLYKRANGNNGVCSWWDSHITSHTSMRSYYIKRATVNYLIHIISESVQKKRIREEQTYKLHSTPPSKSLALPHLSHTKHAANIPAT